jgi:hypothetical protein
MAHEAMPGTLSVVTFSVSYPNDENRREAWTPLLTYNLPQGEYCGIDAADVTLDFMVTGARLNNRGYHVAYYVDGKRFLAFDTAPRHLKGLEPGFHKIRLELLDEKGRLVAGPFNSAERVILLSPDKVPERKPRDCAMPGQATIPSIHGAMTHGQPWVAEIPEDQRLARQREKSEEGTAPRPARSPGLGAKIHLSEKQKAAEQLSVRQATPKPEATNEETTPATRTHEHEEVSRETEKPISQAPQAARRPVPTPSVSPTPAAHDRMSTTPVGMRRYFKESNGGATTATIQASNVYSTGTALRRVEPATPTASDRESTSSEP